METIDQLIEASKALVTHRLWVLSDLQQRMPRNATYCMVCAVDDFLSLGMPVDAVCYLGDAVEGHELDCIIDMAIMQEKQLARVNAPVYYTIGNHDFDYYEFHHKQLDCMRIPFVEYMANIKQWHVPRDLSLMHFFVDVGNYSLCFLTDHADPKGRWYTTHGEVRHGLDSYPYSKHDYGLVTKAIMKRRKPVITLSHYSFPGGNREAPLYKQFLPLPNNVKMHFYGHAHVGDAVWAGKDCYRQIAAIENQPIVQINVASLENLRGNAIRSVIVDLYTDGSIGVAFRNHSAQCWDNYLVVRTNGKTRTKDDHS